MSVAARQIDGTAGDHARGGVGLDSIFVRPDRVAPLADALAEQLEPFSADVVCGPLVGGALLGQLLAARLRAKSVYSERTSHKPGNLFSAIYEVPAGLRPALLGARVLLVEDVVNAGSATGSTIASVRALGGRPALAALLQLGDGADELGAREGIEVVSLGAWPGTLWEPSICPRCAAGVPLQRMSA